MILCVPWISYSVDLMKFQLTLALLLSMAASSVDAAQSLAAVAKKEEERRKDLKSAGKVYTNEHLKPDHVGAEAPADDSAPANVSPAEPSTQVPSVNLPAGRVDDAPEPVKDEAYWRGRIGVARSALERSQIFAEALQSRINALNADFVNRDDPAQRSQIDLERQRALAELERVKKEMGVQTRAIADIEEDARKAGVPAGWLR